MQFDYSIVVLLLTVVGLTEAGVEVIKLIFPLNDPKHKQLASVAMGILFSFLVGASIFVPTNTPIMVVGTIVTGLIASRGSNFAHEVIKIIEQVRAAQEAKVELQEAKIELLKPEFYESEE